MTGFDFLGLVEDEADRREDVFSRVARGGVSDARGEGRVRLYGKPVYGVFRRKDPPEAIVDIDVDGMAIAYAMTRDHQRAIICRVEPTYKNVERVLELVQAYLAAKS